MEIVPFVRLSDGRWHRSDDAPTGKITSAAAVSFASKTEAQEDLDQHTIGQRSVSRPGHFRSVADGGFADWTNVPKFEVQRCLLDPGRYGRSHKSLPRQRHSPALRQRARVVKESWTRAKLTRPSAGDI